MHVWLSFLLRNLHFHRIWLKNWLAYPLMLYWLKVNPVNFWNLLVCIIYCIQVVASVITAYVQHIARNCEFV